MAITKSVWESTRPSECKNSGIGKAIDKWLTTCLPMDKLTDVSALIAAGQAEKEFAKAIGVAQQKLAPVKATDKKKAPTEKLLKEWASTASLYSQSLATETKRRQTEGIKEMETEKKEREKLIAAKEVACESVVQRLETVSNKVIQSLFGAREDLQKVNEALETALDAQATGDTIKGPAAAKSADILSLKLAARVKEAETDFRGAMDFAKGKWAYDPDLSKPGDKLDKLDNRKITFEQQIPNNINSIKKMVDDAKERAVEALQVSKGTGDKVKIYKGQCERLVGQLRTWANERGDSVRSSQAGLDACKFDMMNYDETKVSEEKAEHKKKAFANFQEGVARLKILITLLKGHGEAYNRSYAALPKDIVNDSSPVFKPLLADVHKWEGSLIEDREIVKKAGETVKKLSEKLKTLV